MMENENNNTEEVTQNTSPEVNNMESGTDSNVIQSNEVPQQPENTQSVDTTPQTATIDETSQQSVGEIPQIGNTEQQPATTPIIDSEEQKKKGILPIIIAVVAVLGLAGFLLVPKLLMSNKKIIENEITTVFTAAKKSLKEGEKNILDFDLEKDSLGVNGTLSIDSNYKQDGIDLSKLKNYKITYQGAIDKKSNEASAQLGLLKDAKELLSADGYINGKKVLISLGDLYEKGITTEIDTEIKELDFSKNGSIEDLEKLIDKTEKIVKDTIKDDDIKKSKEEKEINGKKEKYTKIEYTIDTNKLSKEVLKAYQEDEEIIKILANLTEQDEKDIKDTIKEAIEELEKEEEENTIIINTYLKGLGNEIVEIEITDTDGKDKIVIDKEKNVYKYYLQADGEKVLNGEYNDKEESFTLESDEGISLKITTEKDTRKISFDYKMGTESVSINATVTNKVTSSNQESNMVIDVVYNSGDEKITATIKNDMTITKNQKVEKVNKSQTVDIDDMTDADMDKITNAAYEKLEDLIKDIMPSLVEDGTSFRKIMD